MLVAPAVHVFICAITENRGDFVAVFLGSCLIQFLERIVIFSKSLNRIHCKKRRIDILALRMYMLLMVLQNMLRDFPDSLIVMIEVVNIDIVAFAVLRIIQLFQINTFHRNPMRKDGSLVLDREAKDISIRDRILDHVAVQAGFPPAAVRLQSRVEHIRGGSAVCPSVCLKDRRSRETDVIGSLKMALNIPMHLPELRPVALIDNENHLFVPVRIHQGFVALRFDRVRHLLDCCDDHFSVGVRELFHQHIGAVGVVDAVLLKGVVLVNGLII